MHFLGAREAHPYGGICACGEELTHGTVDACRETYRPYVYYIFVLWQVAWKPCRNLKSSSCRDKKSVVQKGTRTDFV